MQFYMVNQTIMPGIFRCIGSYLHVSIGSCASLSDIGINSFNLCAKKFHPQKVPGSKLILFLSRFLATSWSKKVAKCKMWVAKIGKKINHFFLVAPCAKLHGDKIDENPRWLLFVRSLFVVERLRSSPRLYTNRKKRTVGITTEIDAKYFCECIIKLLSFVWV